MLFNARSYEKGPRMLLGLENFDSFVVIEVFFPI